jgi:4-hydroxybenzoate polyprenyltransferase
MNASHLPIAVDLDGTLSRSDTLHDQVVRAALRNPLALLFAIPEAFRSRARFKAALAGLSFRAPPQCVWDEVVLDFLRSAPNAQKVLCTASNRIVAERLVEPLGLFSEVIGSDAQTNLKGEAKAAALSERFGSRAYIYVGNDTADLPAWSEAARAVVVSDDAELVRKARAVCSDVLQLAPNKPPLIATLWKALRPHQWTKNLLVLVPVLTSHRFNEPSLLLAGALAFGVFCMLSSAVYVINDVLDLDADRLHASKRKRPFASGDLSVLWAPPLGGALATVSLALAFQSGVAFGLACSAYLVLSLLYSTVFKKVALLDVFVLAALYTLRLLAGGALTGIPISVWLAAFSAFIFLSLALCKRYVEILELPPHPAARIARRGYGTGDASFVLTQGLIAMGCASLVLAVYLSSTAVTLLYRTPGLLWGAVAVVSFWGARIWLLASRRELHDDPVLFALKDPVSWVCLGLLFAVFFAAMLLG